MVCRTAIERCEKFGKCFAATVLEIVRLNVVPEVIKLLRLREFYPIIEPGSMEAGIVREFIRVARVFLQQVVHTVSDVI